MRNKLSGIINIVVTGFLLISINTFFKPCQGVMQMPCNYSTKAAELILVIILILNIGRLFVEDVKGRLFMDITTVAAGLELIFVPHIGRCQMASMSCNAKTFPALRVGALLIIILTVIFEVISLINSRRERHVHSK